MSHAIRRLFVAVVATALMLMPGVSQAKVTFKLGHLAPTDHHYHAGAVMFRDMVKKMSNGDIEIKIFPANQLGKQRELVEGAQLGTVDMVLTSDVLLSSFEESMGVLNMPFLFRDIDHVGKVLDGKIGRMLSDNLAKKGLVVLGYWENGFRHITNSKRPINKPEDLAGLKIRTPSGYVFVDSFKAFGASPTPMAFGELYSALQLGTVDGQENPLAHVEHQKFYEVQKYLTLTSHIHVSEPLVMSKLIYDTLSLDQQKILHEAAQKVAAWMRAEVSNQEADLLEALKLEMTVNTADRAAFEKASEAVYKQHADRFGKWIKDIKAVQ